MTLQTFGTPVAAHLMPCGAMNQTAGFRLYMADDALLRYMLGCRVGHCLDLSRLRICSCIFGLVFAIIFSLIIQKSPTKTGIFRRFLTRFLRCCLYSRIKWVTFTVTINLHLLYESGFTFTIRQQIQIRIYSGGVWPFLGRHFDLGIRLGIRLDLGLWLIREPPWTEFPASETVAMEWRVCHIALLTCPVVL